MIEQESKSSRRWMQFSLRSLLTIMLVVAAFLAGRMPVQRELERLRAIEKDAIKQREMELVAREQAEKALMQAERALRMAEQQRELAADATRRLEEEAVRQENDSVSSRPTPKAEQEEERTRMRSDGSPRIRKLREGGEGNDLDTSPADL